MHSSTGPRETDASSLPKTPTGIHGLDQITGGGVPQGRPTLVCGGPGCGKTLLGMEFLVHGAMDYNEPGVCMMFEESAEELTRNVRSLGFDLAELIRQQKLLIDYVRVERREIEETGDYDLEGLFIRLGFAIDSIGAKRVLLDTIETLFSGLSNQGILRSELRRLFRWLKDKGVTAVITGERGSEGLLTRQGLEEYVSDCVIVLDHRVNDQVSTRRLRIVKYRGSPHGTNEYPFLIDRDGISVLPVTSLELDHEVSIERVSSGVPPLDAMLGGEGYYRGSSILVTGRAGTGKTSLASHFVRAACERGQRALYMAYEESPGQLVRNMRSIGVDLGPAIQQGLLKIAASRPTIYGLEMHLTRMHKLIEGFRPNVVALDPMSSFSAASTSDDARLMLMRLVDYLKSLQITAMFTGLTGGGRAIEETEVGISSLMDTWLLLRDIELSGERNRVLCVLKSRGMAHSNQVREFRLTDQGIDLIDVYLGPECVLTGSARLAQEAKERAESAVQQQEIEAMRRELERKRQALEARIAVMRVEYETDEERLRQILRDQELREQTAVAERKSMLRSRKLDE